MKWCSHCCENKEPVQEQGYVSCPCCGKVFWQLINSQSLRRRSGILMNLFEIDDLEAESESEEGDDDDIESIEENHSESVGAATQNFDDLSIADGDEDGRYEVGNDDVEMRSMSI